MAQTKSEFTEFVIVFGPWPVILSVQSIYRLLHGLFCLSVKRVPLISSDCSWGSVSLYLDNAKYNSK